VAADVRRGVTHTGPRDAPRPPLSGRISRTQNPGLKPWAVSYSRFAAKFGSGWNTDPRFFSSLLELASSSGGCRTINILPLRGSARLCSAHASHLSLITSHFSLITRGWRHKFRADRVFYGIGKDFIDFFVILRLEFPAESLCYGVQLACRSSSP
jgi:hypothetical protein